MGTESTVPIDIANNSLLPNETGSTRIWKLPMRLLRDLRVNWNLWLEAGLGVDRIGERKLRVGWSCGCCLFLNLSI
jgi:hypothetical protein